MDNIIGNNRGQTEAFWHQCLLITILIVAACARFYSLDEISLSSTELNNLLASNIKGWGTMVTYYANNGMPPLYPSLLYFITHLVNDSALCLRLFSVLAGLGAIYVLYITGRDFISPTAGLLAAAMAAEYQIILVNREATLYSLLMLCCLIQNYCFCRLFFSRHYQEAHIQNNRPLTASYSGTSIHFQWSWRPSFPSDARYLAGFWIASALAFYTSPMSLILICSEIVASVFLIKQSRDIPNWRFAMRSLWLPLLLVMLPWMPVIYGYSEWIQQGHLLAFQTPAVLWDHVRHLIPSNPKFQYLLIALTSTLPIAILMNKLFKKNHLLPSRFVGFMLFQSILALISLWLILVASSLSYLYFWWLFVLLALMPISLCIDAIPSNVLKKWIIGIAVILIMVMQIKSNAYYKLYDRGGDADFRLTAKILHDDQDFMKGNKNIVMSSELFRHYLQTNNIITSNIALLNTHAQPNSRASAGHSDFYYLEYAPYDKALQNETSAYQTLSGQYKKVCMTKMPWIRIVKFSQNSSIANNETQDCRVFLSGVTFLR